MRNLKKVLSLALVLVMVLAVSASAVYPDQAAIGEDYVGSVNLLSAIKVMQGKGAGQFDPTAPVTRAEMAKMIYVGKTGADDGATLYAGMDVEFDDLEGAGWAENYIKWANFKNIVVGSNGKFRPLDNVKGVEAAKMILTAVGYDADIEGYQNDAYWSFNIAEDAQELGLLEVVTADVLGRAITREEAAQMIAQGLALPTVEGYSETGVADDDGASLLETKFQVKIETEYTVLKTATKGIGGAAGYVDEDKTQENVVFIGANIPVVAGVTVDPALVGHAVTVYYKDTGDNDAINTNDVVYSIIDAGTSIEAAELPEYKYEDEEVEPDESGATYVVNGAVADGFTAADLTDGMTTTYIYETGTDEDGVIDEVIVNYVFVDAVAYGAAQAVTVEATEDEEEYVNVTLTVDGDEFATVKAADLAGSDILTADAEDATAVLITWNFWADGENGEFSIALPETIEGYVSATSNKTGDTLYTIGGTAYALSEMIGAGIEVDADGDDALDVYVADDNAKYTYVVYDGKLVAADEVNAPSSAIEPDNYMLVLDFADNQYTAATTWTEAESENAKVLAVLGTGAEGTYAITGLSTGADIEGDEVVGDYIWEDEATIETEPVVAYKQAEDGTLIVDKSVALTAGTIAADYANGSIMKLATGNKIVADDALFFVKVDDDADATLLEQYALYTKGNVPTLTAGYDNVDATVVNYLVVDGKIAVVYIDTVPADLETDDVLGDMTLLYVIDDYSETVGEETTVYAYAFDTAKVVEIVVAEAPAAGWYYAQSVNGVYTLEAAELAGTELNDAGDYILTTEATIAAVDGAYVTIGEDEAAVTYLNTASAKALTVETKTVADHTIAAEDEHVLVVVNADATEIVAMYVIK